MIALFGLLVSAMFINNIVLNQLLGLTTFFGVTSHKKIDALFKMSIGVIILMLLTTIIIYPIQVLVLEPLNITYLETIITLIVIVALTYGLAFTLKTFKDGQYQALHVYVPLIATNTAILGVTLINVLSPQTFIESIIVTLGSGLGYSLILLTFTTIRLRLSSYAVPKTFKGLPIALITAGLMALAFLGLAGVL